MLTFVRLARRPVAHTLSRAKSKAGACLQAKRGRLGAGERHVVSCLSGVLGTNCRRSVRDTSRGRTGATWTGRQPKITRGRNPRCIRSRTPCLKAAGQMLIPALPPPSFNHSRRRRPLSTSGAVPISSINHPADPSATPAAGESSKRASDLSCRVSADQACRASTVHVVEN